MRVSWWGKNLLRRVYTTRAVGGAERRQWALSAKKEREGRTRNITRDESRSVEPEHVSNNDIGVDSLDEAGLQSDEKAVSHRRDLREASERRGYHGRGNSDDASDEGTPVDTVPVGVASVRVVQSGNVVVELLDELQEKGWRSASSGEVFRKRPLTQKSAVMMAAKGPMMTA